MNPGWVELGALASTDLVEERLQAHWAAQTLSAATQAAIDALPGDAHTNLGWDREAGAFVTHPFPGGSVAGFSLPELALHWSPADGAPGSGFELEGQTLEAARNWLTGLVRSSVPDLPAGAVPLRDYDMPSHPVAEGRPFGGGDRDAFAELARWYGTADDALTEIAGSRPNTSPVRTWPHHFDIGLLISLEPDVDPEHARSIGIGLGPGDAAIRQPYYYVNPYPRPNVDDLPELPSGGSWERDAFFGALLTGTAVIGGGDSVGRRGRVLDFLTGAIDACRTLLGE